MDPRVILSVLAWPALSFASLIGFVVLLARGFGVRPGYHWIALALGAATSGWLLRSEVFGGQSGALGLFLLTAGLVLRSQNRVVGASALFAIMTALQPFTAAVMIHFVLRGDWRVVGWSLGFGAGLLIAFILPAWPNTFEAASGEALLGSVTSIQQLLSQPLAASVDNESAYGLIFRMFKDTPLSTPWIDSSNLAPAVMTLAASLAAVLAIVGLHLGKREEWDDEAPIDPAPAILLLECSLVLALVAFLSPFASAGHLTFSFAGLAGALIVGLKRIREKQAHAMLWMIAIAAWLMLALTVLLPRSVWPAYGIDPASAGLSAWQILLSGHIAIALFLAGATTAIALWRERSSAAAVVIPKRPFGRRRSLAQPMPDAVWSR